MSYFYCESLTLSKKKTDLTNISSICYAPLPEFKHFFAQCTRQQVRNYVEACLGLNPFHHVLDQIDTPDTREKIIYLMQRATDLGLDPNEIFYSSGPSHFSWNNSPLSHCIAYENLGLLSIFLQSAKREGFHILLNAVDKSGKTPLMFAIKLGWTPIETIQSLVTPENYNQPEHSGMTPIMAACALRRLDIAQILIQYEANRLSLGEIDYSKPTDEQSSQLSPFMHQVHPESGKTLGHYALMRTGTLVDQRKDLNYQETVLNVLKAAGVDGFRDEAAHWNSIVTAKKEGILYLGPPGTTTLISYINFEDFGNRVYLSAKTNEPFLLDMASGDLKAHLSAVFKTFTGISLAKSILSRSQDMIQLLARMGFDFSLEQANGKTTSDYIQGLMNASNPQLISPLDEQYLFKLKPVIAHYLQQGQDDKIRLINTFFGQKSFKPAITDLIVSYSGMTS